MRNAFLAAAMFAAASGPVYAQVASASSTVVDFSAIVNPILTALGLALASLVTVLGKRALTVFETRTGIQLTAAQKDSIRGAADTLGGLLQSEVQKGVLAVDQVHIGNAAVRQLAQGVIPVVSGSLAAQGTTIDAFLNMGIANLAARLGADTTVPGTPTTSVVTATATTSATATAGRPAAEGTIETAGGANSQNAGATGGSAISPPVDPSFPRPLTGA